MKKASPALGADPSVHDEEGPRSGDGSPATQASAAGGAAPQDARRIRLIAELARGGMGNVYLAVARGLGGFNKLVVVKELKAEFVDDEAYVAMFLEEARLAARLSHPNIVQTNEVISEGNRHCMVMEYLQGRSLDRVVRRLSRQGRLPEGAYLRIVADVLLALDYAHRLRGFGGEHIEVVHRDVSPPNVVVTFEGQTKLLDFGVAKSTDSQLETQSGVLKGRVAYMAPEQARGGQVDRRADVYAAGVMIWEAVAGRRLWPEKTNVEILLHLLNETPPRLRDVRPDAPGDLDAIVARALARNPDDRHPTAAALLDDLQEHLRRRRDLLPAREVGALVARAFDDETQRLRSLVDEALAGTAPLDRVPSLLGPTLSTGTFSIGRRDVLGEASAAGRMPTSSGRAPSVPPPPPRTSQPPPFLPPPQGRTSQPPPFMASPFASFAPPPAPASHALMPPALSAPPGPARSMAPSWLVPAAVAMAIGASLAVIAGNTQDRWRGPAPAVAPLVTSLPADNGAAPAVALPVVETIDLDVRATPRWAQIMVDDIQAPSNPFHARLRRDGKAHRIAVSADGYDTKTEDVTFSGDVAVDLALERRVGPPVRRTPPGARPPGKVPADPPHTAIAAPTSAPVAAAPSDVRAGQRPIVTANPYGTP